MKLFLEFRKASVMVNLLQQTAVSFLIIVRGPFGKANLKGHCHNC
jgi:hypothetical protein